MARRNVAEFKVKVKDDASHALQSVNKEVGLLGGKLKGLAGVASGLAAVLGTREILQMADSYRLLQNRLKLVTKSTEELNAVTREIVATSFEARTSFQSTADLYARVARSSRELGLSQRELITFSKTVSKSIRISGSTAQEAAAGVIQFGQALASSRLSGDELRSVLEQMPRLAQAIAEGMGVGIGRLREMGEAGELSAERVLEALRKVEFEMALEFSALDPLVSEAMGNVQTALMTTIGLIDKTSGASAFMAENIIVAAKQLILFGEAATGALTKVRPLNESQKEWALSVSKAIKAGKGLEAVLRESTDDTVALAGALGVTIQELIDLEGTAAAFDGTIDLTFEGIKGAIEEHKDLLAVTKTLAGAFVILQFAAISFYDSLKLNSPLLFKIPGEFVAAFAAQVHAGATLAGQGDAATDAIYAIGASFNERLWSGFDSGGPTLEERKAKLETDFKAMMDALDKINFPELRPDALEVDLDADSDALGDIGRKAREELARSTKTLEKLKTTILQQSQAYVIVAESGGKYKDVLQEVKIKSLGAATSQAELVKQAVLLAEKEDIPYAAALAVVEEKSQGATEALKKLSAEVLKADKELRVNINIASDKDALADLRERIHLERISAKAKFVYIELQKISAEMSGEEATAYQILAEELFDLMEVTNERLKFMENAAEQAAQNMQNAFAEFFFDPFEDGLKGLLVGFLNVIRRMIAEVLAFQALESANESSGWLSMVFKGITGAATSNTNTDTGNGLPGAAAGGPIRKGQTALVGERGPELFVPSVPGMIKAESDIGDTRSKAIEKGIPVIVGTNGPEIFTPKKAGRVKPHTAIGDIATVVIKEGQPVLIGDKRKEKTQEGQPIIIKEHSQETFNNEILPERAAGGPALAGQPILVPERAAGGPALAGQPILVGERGPELFVPTGSGRIKPNSGAASIGRGSGDTQFVTNIDARGADPGLIARLPAILEARDRNLMAIMQRFVETGVMPI